MAMLLEMLWPHRARWEMFSVGLDDSMLNEWLHHARKEPIETLPLLRSLSLPVAGQDVDATDLFSRLINIPSLTKLSLLESANAVLSSRTLQRIQWSGLHTVSLQEPVGDPIVLTLLTALANVTLLHLSINVNISPSAPLPLEPNELHAFPNLQAFSLYGSLINVVMVRMVAPQLRPLELSYHSHADILHDFITRSCGQSSASGTTHLVIADRCGGSLPAVVRSLVALQVLNIQQPVNANAVAQILQQLMDPKVCPVLNAMQINVHCMDDFHGAVSLIAEFLRSRYLALSTLLAQAYATRDDVELRLINSHTAHSNKLHLRLCIFLLANFRVTEDALKSLQCHLACTRRQWRYFRHRRWGQGRWC